MTIELNTISEAIRLLRIYSDIKQGDMAEKLNISNSYLSEMEKGRKAISLEVLEKYGKIFNLTVSNITFFAEQLKKNKSLKRDIFMSIIQKIKEGV